MSTWTDTVLIAFACLAAIPSGVFLIECLIGAMYWPRPPLPAAEPAPRVAILMPAHDEAAGIGKTVAALLPQLHARDTLLVVADNCSDDTATLAAASGATVATRQDGERRGKGYALVFGLERLAQDPPDVVVIVDADCTVSDGGIERLARMARSLDRPIQADYVLTPAERPSGRSVISALAFLVKNRVRPRGLAALSLPCLLTGTGMAFPWHVLRKAPPTNDHLVEDMVMGLELALLGHAPRLCADACVTSALPERTQAATAQRKRWEHGHLATLIAHGPRLLGQGLLRRRVELIAIALDLMVPPLSLLVAILLAGLVLSAIGRLFSSSNLPLAIFGANLAAIGIGVFVGWFAYGRKLVRGRDLLAIPLYVLWKLPLYFGFFFRGRQRSWERTEREARPTSSE